MGGGQPTQGVALGYALVAPSGRTLNACFPLGTILFYLRNMSLSSAKIVQVSAMKPSWLEIHCRAQPIFCKGNVFCAKPLHVAEKVETRKSGSLLSDPAVHGWPKETPGLQGRGIEVMILRYLSDGML